MANAISKKGERDMTYMKGRWRCLGATLVICLFAGFGYAWSVVQTPIVSLYGWDAAGVALTFTLTVGMSTLSPLFLGKFIQNMPVRRTVMIGAVIYGFGLFATGFIGSLWQLYLFYGVFSGLGCGMIYPTMMSYSVRLFPDRSGLASGLATAFYGAGAILWAPVMVSLNDSFSLGIAFRILGASFAAVILAAALLLREPPETSAAKPGASDDGENATGQNLRRSEMVKTVRFYVTVAAFSLGLTAGLMVISQASPILQQSLGYTPARAALFVSIFAACNMAGRFLWGSVSDKIGIFASVACIFMLCIIAMAGLSLIGFPALMLVCMGIAASCYGGLASVLTPLIVRLFGRRYITENYGVAYIVFGIASLLAPNLAIRFAAATGSYTGAYITAGVFAIIGLACSRILKRVVK